MLYHTVSELEQKLAVIRQEGLTIGLVPTMGALHEGHLSLVATALEKTQRVVVTIFVNPTQFNNQDDLEKYPSDIKKDVILLKELSGDIIVFAPSVSEIYAENIVSKTFDFGGLDNYMEGANRPGHFHGVATIVEELFSIVRPDKAFFGEKDYQQLAIIKHLNKSLNWGIDIVPCPIVREVTGLALSSRNERLSMLTRIIAGGIHQTLEKVKSSLGTSTIDDLKKMVDQTFEEDKLMELEYFEIAESETLVPSSQIDPNKKYRAFIAVHTENVRLIDNIALN